MASFRTHVHGEVVPRERVDTGIRERRRHPVHGGGDGVIQGAVRLLRLTLIIILGDKRAFRVRFAILLRGVVDAALLVAVVPSDVGDVGDHLEVRVGAAGGNAVTFVVLASDADFTIHARARFLAFAPQ